MSDEDSNHLIKARRVVANDLLNVSDGQGATYDGVVIEVGPPVVAELGPPTLVAQSVPRMRFFQAIAKSEKNELVLQKLVEIGVDEIVFFTASRSVPRWDEAKTAKMQSRHVAIAHAAAKQSRRAWLPHVRGPITFAEVVTMIGPHAYVADADAPPFAIADAPVQEVALIVGPEGGLTETELMSLTNRGATRVGLGPNTLRTETAAIVLATVARHACGLI